MCRHRVRRCHWLAGDRLDVSNGGSEPADKINPDMVTAQMEGGKPLLLYVVGQSFNLILTLTMAYIMFYLVFPEITAAI